MHHVDDACASASPEPRSGDRPGDLELRTACQDAAVRSRARRRRAAHRLAAVARRRRRRGSSTAVLLTLAVSVSAPLAIGQSVKGRSADAPTGSAVIQRGDRGADVRALQRALGISADGVFGPATAKAVRKFQRRNGLDVDGVVGPATRRALGLSAPKAKQREEEPATEETAADDSAVTGDPASLLASIAQCESGGDPTAVSSDGTYRGKYQFRRDTWRSLGGTGDPAEADEAEQDRLAAKLLAERGTAPWPVCGRQAKAAASRRS